MSRCLLNPKVVFFFFFAFVNVLSFFWVTTNQGLIGETSAISFTHWDIVVPVLLMLIAGYFFILCPLFLFFKSFYIKHLFQNEEVSLVGTPVGLIVLSLQLLFIIYFSLTGTFSANSTERAGTIGSAFWVCISIDNIFLIYYALFRETKLFKYNLFFSVLSNVLRGWSSIFFAVVFLELCRLYRANGLRLFYFILSVLVVSLLYPFIYLGKLVVRTMTISGGSFSSSLEMVVSGLENGAGSSNFLSALYLSLEQIVTRFQLLSNALAVYQVRDYLTEKINLGLVVPYWAESIYGIFFCRLFDINYGNNIGVMMANIISSFPLDSSWNSNPSFLAWFFIKPELSVLYVYFLLGVCALSIFLCRLTASSNFGSRSGLYLDLVWFSWLIYILPGWNASLVLFVHTQMVFLIILSISIFIVKLSNFKNMAR